MACGKGGYSEDVNVVFHGLTGSFGGSLEERAHVDVETAVGIAGCDNFGAAVVTVLTHFSHHDTGLAPFALGEFLGHLLCADEVGIIFGF